MFPSRFRITSKSSDKLKFLKMKTGLTPNILARFALMKSLAEDKDVNVSSVPLDGLEFNAPTLFGEYALLYEQLLVSSGDDAATINLKVAKHIENGLASFRGIHNLLEFTKRQV